jgi:MFS family permease
MFVFMLLHNAQDEKQTEKTVNLQPCELKIIQVALLLALIGGFIETSSVSLLPFYFAVDGFSLQSSAWLVSSFGLGGTLLQLPLGFLVDKLGYSRAQLIACIVALIGLLGLFIAPIEFITLYLTVFFFGGAIGAFNTLAVIQVGSQIVSHKSASGMAYVAIFYTIGSVVGPIVISFTLDSFLSDFMLGVYAVLVITLMVVIVRQSFKRV